MDLPNGLRLVYTHIQHLRVKVSKKSSTTYTKGYHFNLYAHEAMSETDFLAAYDSIAKVTTTCALMSAKGEDVELVDELGPYEDDSKGLTIMFRGVIYLLQSIYKQVPKGSSDFLHINDIYTSIVIFKYSSFLDLPPFQVRKLFDIVGGTKVDSVDLNMVRDDMMFTLRDMFGWEFPEEMYDDDGDDDDEEEEESVDVIGQSGSTTGIKETTVLSDSISSVKATPRERDSVRYVFELFPKLRESKPITQ